MHFEREEKRREEKIIDAECHEKSCKPCKGLSRTDEEGEGRKRDRDTNRVVANDQWIKWT